MIILGAFTFRSLKPAPPCSTHPQISGPLLVHAVFLGQDGEHFKARHMFFVFDLREVEDREMLEVYDFALLPLPVASLPVLCSGPGHARSLR
jgi:hypothetical protein